MDLSQELQNSSEFLSALLEHTHEGIIACNQEGTLTFFNKAAREMHGVGQKDIPPSEWARTYNLYHVDGVTPLEVEEIPLYRAYKGEYISDAEMVVIRQDGTKLIISCNGQPLYDSKKKLMGAMITIQDITETRVMKQRLEEAMVEKSRDLFKTKTRFRTIFEQSPFSIQIVSTDGKTVLVNDAYKKLWGFSEEVVQNIVLKDFNILQDPILKAKGLLPLFERAFAGEIVEIPEFLYDPNDLGVPGNAVWAYGVLYPLKNEDGLTEEIVIMHIDVTREHEIRAEREKLLDELHRERNQLNTILQQLPVGVLVADAKTGEYSVKNAEMLKVLGPEFLDSGQMENIPRFRGFHLDGSELKVEEWPISRALASGEVVTGAETMVELPTGKRIFLSINAGPIKNPEGEIIAGVAVVNDVTDKKRLEKTRSLLEKATSLLQSSLDFDVIVQQVGSAAIPEFADGCMLDIVEEGRINRIITRHRCPEVEKLLFKLQQEFPPTMDSPQPTAKVIRSGKPELMTVVDSTQIAAHTFNQEHAKLIEAIGINSHVGVPLQIRGKVIGSINFFLSTDRPKYDAFDLNTAIELARRIAIAIHNGRLYQEAKKAIADREDFISIASHELKTPITSLKLQWEVASRTIYDSDTSIDPQYVKKLAGISKRQLDRLTRLVEDMLDISRMTTGKLPMVLKEVDLADVVGEVNERFMDQLQDLGIELKVKELTPVKVICDHVRIEQVITNLITNAIRYGLRRPIEVSLSKKDKKAILKVRDYGRGLAQEDHERIFERFGRAINSDDSSGLGLGLYISREIVQEHQGHIWLESALHKGSTFYVELPAID